MKTLLQAFLYTFKYLKVRQQFLFNECLVIFHHTKRFIAILTFTISSVSTSAYANAPQCESLFSDVVLLNTSNFDEALLANEMFAKAYQEEYAALNKWWKKSTVQLLRSRIKNKVLVQCKSGCTEADISRIVADSVEGTFEKIESVSYQGRRIRGFAILTGITVGTIIGGSYLKMHLSPNERFLSELVSTATTIAIYKLGAPLLDQVTALAVRGGYRLQDGKEFFRKNMEFVRLRALYKVLREKMTPLEQEEAGRMSTLLGQLAPTFGTAIESLESADKSKGGMPAAAARIADIAIRMRQYFPEIAPDNPEVIRTIQMVFTQRIVTEDPGSKTSLVADKVKLQKLYELIIKQIEIYDPLYKESENAAKLYQQGIQSWLGLGLGL